MDARPAFPERPAMSLLDRFRLARTQRTRQPENERRRACRSRAVVRDVVLGCEQGGTRDDLPASLEDVSIDGCLAKSRSMPLAKPGDPIWLGLAGSHPAERIQGTLIDART